MVSGRRSTRSTYCTLSTLDLWSLQGEPDRNERPLNVSYDFSSKVAVVTGAARGVGRVIVGSLAAAGAGVVAADRDADGLADTCAPLGKSVLAVVGDISTPEGAAVII